MHPKTAFILFTAVQSSAICFVSALFTPFLQQIGVSQTQIFLVGLTFVCCQVFAELPTGVLADSRGRRWSMTMGSTFSALGFLTHGLAFTFPMVLAGEVFHAVGAAFISGSANAWIADALTRRGELTHLHDVYAKANKARWAFSIIASVGGTWVGGTFAIRLPWFFAAGVMTGIILFTRWFMDPNEGEPTHRVSEWEAIRISWRLARHHANLRWIAFASLAFGLAWTMSHLWQPYYLDFLRTSQLGIVWVVASLGQLSGSDLLSRLHRRANNSPLYIFWSVFLIGGGLLGLAYTTPFYGAIAWTFLHNMGRGLMNPTLSAYTQEHLDSSVRATFDSFRSMCQNAGMGMAYLLNLVVLTGVSYSSASSQLAWSVSGPLIILVGFFLFIFRPKDA